MAEDPAIATQDAAHMAPPPAPPVEIQTEPAEETDNFRPSGTTLYSISEPSDEEQFFLEYINWARADANNAANEYYNTTDPDVLAAYSYFGVDLDEMLIQFADLPSPRPPLSFNEKLLTAARLHSQDMFDNTFQGHISSPNPPPPHQSGDEPADRVGYQNYSFGALGENVYAYAQSVWHGHCGLDVDWGDNPPTGMQDPPGHRYNIHDYYDSGFTEIGIGVVLGTKSGTAWNTGTSTTVGPVIVTQDFAKPSGTIYPFITGVVYYDLDGNGFYGAGEGLGGIRVDVAGEDYYAVTSQSGGYSIPVLSGDGDYNLTFQGSNLTDYTPTATVSGNEKVKQDWTPLYVPPDIIPPGGVYVNEDNAIAFNQTGGATAYIAREAELGPGTWVEGAEDGGANVTIQQSGTYDVIQSDVKYAGTYAYHLCHPDGIADEIITLDRLILPSGTSDLVFQSRLGYATSDQHAIAEVSTDGGTTWTQVYFQAGDGGSGESSFNQRAVSLAAYDGKELRVRFIYSFGGSSYYNQTSAGVGWYLDDIQVTNSNTIENSVETEIADTPYIFHPTEEMDYLLQVRAKNVNRLFPYADAVIVSPVTGIILEPVSTAPSGSLLEVRFRVTNGPASSLLMQEAPAPDGPWTDTGLAPEDLGGGEYRFNYDLSGKDAVFLRPVAEH